MAFIDLCKKDSQSALIEAVCISGGECIVLHPIISKAVENARKKVEHYEDLICDGYGTKRQETSLSYWQNRLDALESIESAIETMLKEDKK